MKEFRGNKVRGLEYRGGGVKRLHDYIMGSDEGELRRFIRGGIRSFRVGVYMRTVRGSMRWQCISLED